MKKTRMHWVQRDKEKIKKTPTIPHPTGPRPIHFLEDPQRKSKAFAQKRKTVEKKVLQMFLPVVS